MKKSDAQGMFATTRFFRMVPVKERQPLTDKTSIKGSIPVATTDHVAGGLETGEENVTSFPSWVVVKEFFCSVF